MLYLKKIGAGLVNVQLFRLIALLVYTIYYITSLFNIETIPRGIVLLWGVFLVGYDILVTRRFLKQKYWYLLLLLSISYLISVITNLPYGMPYTVVNLFYVIQTFLLFYPVDYQENEDHLNGWIKRINTAFIIVVFMASLASVLLYVFNIHYWILDSTSGEWQRQGFIENRLFGVYSNPNVGSIFGVVAMILSLQNNIFSGRKLLEFTKWGWVNIGVQFVYVLLSVSRGTMIMGSVFLLSMFICYSYHIDFAHNSFLRALGNSLGKLFLGAFLLFSVYLGTETVMSYIPGVIQYTQNSFHNVDGENSDTATTSQETSFTSIKPVTIQHSEEGAEVTSGRLAIWQGAFHAMSEKPWFGLADTYLYRNMKENEITSQIDMSKLSQLDRVEFKRSKGYLHNTYVASLTKSGIIGFTILMIFLVCFFIYHFRYIISKQFDIKDSRDQLFLVSFCFLVSILVNDLVENHILFNNRDVVSVIFWINAGYLNYLRFKKRGNISKCDKEIPFSH